MAPATAEKAKPAKPETNAPAKTAVLSRRYDAMPVKILILPSTGFPDLWFVRMALMNAGAVLVAVCHKPGGFSRRRGQRVVQQHAGRDVKDAEDNDDDYYRYPRL
jgi:hypothetical protein